MSGKRTTTASASSFLISIYPNAHQEVLVTLLSVNYQVKVAVDGPMALEICQGSSPPDLILLDDNMPLMNGYEVCRKPQENRLFCDISVIFVTAAAHEESEIQGLQLSVVDYITKPNNPTFVLLRIRNLMKLKKEEKELKSLQSWFLVVIEINCPRLPLCRFLFLVKLHIIEQHRLANKITLRIVNP